MHIDEAKPEEVGVKLQECHFSKDLLNGLFDTCTLNTPTARHCQCETLPVQTLPIARWVGLSIGVTCSVFSLLSKPFMENNGAFGEHLIHYGIEDHTKHHCINTVCRLCTVYRYCISVLQMLLNSKYNYCSKNVLTNHKFSTASCIHNL